MSAEDRTIALAGARMCAAAAPLTAASVALAIVAFAALAFVDQLQRAAWSWWIVALLGAPALWYGFRLRFDAGVFGDLAASADVDAGAREFDAALATMSGGTVAAPRALDERARGARRLVARLVAIAALQFAVALVAAFPG